MTTANVLVVEDDAALALLIAEELEALAMTVRTVDNLADARRALTTAATDLVVSDLRLPDGNGGELLELLELPTNRPRPAIIIITAFGTVQQAVAALKRGADDFLTKPLDIEHFCLTVERVLQTRALKVEVSRLRHNDHFHGIVGNSRAIQHLCQQIRVIACASGAVLISGESGTGKEMVARAVHAESERADRAFVAVNCAGVPPDLLEAEFFGHAPGAFTGASRERAGLFAQADGGTLLLDEIAEMPLQLQAKLLRVLQDGRIRPIGRDSEKAVDVRVIAATNRDLGKLIDEGRFRKDLYYRLETFRIHVPPLRARGDDAELLAGRFLQRFTAAQDKSVHSFSDTALGLLRHHPFPGNVRELESAVERAVTFCNGDTIGPEHLPERLRRRRAAAAADDDGEGDIAGLIAGDPIMPTLDQLQRRYVYYVLDQVDGNKRRAAALLGIGRRTLYRWLDP